MSFTGRLAKRVQEVDASHMPEDARHWAVVSILDTLGVAIAGCRDPGVETLTRVLTRESAGGDCTIVGTHRMASVLDAAQINGMAAHVLDFDASNPYFAGHASMHLLSGALAAGEWVDATGEEFLVAYLAGFEAQMRIARGLQPAHSNKGWFPSSTLGVFGVAAAVGRLLKLDTQRMTMALSIAAGFSSGLLAHAGTMSKPLASGHSARNGVLAALLARDGFSAREEIFEHKYGFLNMFDAAGHFDASDVLEEWGNPYEIGVTAIGFKQYPCCGIIHAAIDIVVDLMETEGATAAQVERVEVCIVTDQASHIERPDPQSSLEAKFSIYYCVAAAIERGRLKLEDFEGESFRAHEIRELMTRVRFNPHPDAKPGMARDRQGATDVKLFLKGGRVLQGILAQPIGRDPDLPLPDHLVHKKFRSCVSRQLGDAAALQLLDRITHLDDTTSLKSLTQMMRTANGV